MGKERNIRTHVYTTLHTELHSTLEAVLRMNEIIEIFIISAKPEPSNTISAPSSLFEIPKGRSWVLSDMVWICPTGRKCAAKVDGLGDVQRHWLRHRVWRRDLQDEGNRDLGEAEQLRVGDVGWARSKFSSCWTLLKTIDEEKDVLTPRDFDGRVGCRFLNRRKGGKER